MSVLRKGETLLKPWEMFIIFYPNSLGVLYIKQESFCRKCRSYIKNRKLNSNRRGPVSLLLHYLFFLFLPQMVKCLILKHVLRRRSFEKTWDFPLTRTSFAVCSFTSYFIISQTVEPNSMWIFANKFNNFFFFFISCMKE